jgi:hypothetical protein
MPSLYFFKDGMYVVQPEIFFFFSKVCLQTMPCSGVGIADAGWRQDERLAAWWDWEFYGVAKFVGFKKYCWACLLFELWGLLLR